MAEKIEFLQSDMNDYKSVMWQQLHYIQKFQKTTEIAFLYLTFQETKTGNITTKAFHENKKDHNFSQYQQKWRKNKKKPFS